MLFEYLLPLKNVDKDIKIKEYGCIAPKNDSTLERLVVFESDLKSLMYNLKPQYCVLEELNYTRNMDVVRTLGAFVGTAEKIAYEFLKIKPPTINRSHALKVVLNKGNAEKEEARLAICNKFKVEVNQDIADAIAVGYCYILEG